MVALGRLFKIKDDNMAKKIKRKMKKAKEVVQLKQIKISLNKLESHPDNPRDHNERNIQAIVDSFQEFGELGAVVVWGKKNYVIAGNGRLEAAKQIGLKSLTAVRADHLTEAQAKAFMIADNKTTDTSYFNPGKVTQILQDIVEDKYDPLHTGLLEAEFTPLLFSGAAPDPHKEWEDMPEYDNQDLNGYQRIVVHFPTKKDVKKFARLMKQKITDNTKSMWFPEQEEDKVTGERY
jgi:hypothetical protein